ARAYAVFAPDELSSAEPLVHEARSSADDLLLLAFGEDDALRTPSQALINALENAGDRVAPVAQAFAIGVHVLDRLAGAAGLHGGLGTGGRHRRDQPRIERHRDDVVGSVFRA